MNRLLLLVNGICFGAWIIVLVFLAVPAGTYIDYSTLDIEGEDDLLGKERYSPRDRIDPDTIYTVRGFTCAKTGPATIAYYLDTNSMDPVLDVESNGIYIDPKNDTDIKIGDIIGFIDRSNDDLRIAHRVVRIDTDQKGLFYVTKGDNTEFSDAYRVRFEDVKGVLVGVFY